MSDIDWSILKNPNSNVWSQYVDRDEQNAIRGLIAEVERLRVQLNGLGGENELLKKQLRIERGAEAEVERLRGTLQQVLDYRHGQGKYDLSHITNPHEKANAAHDLWYEVEADIRAALDAARSYALPSTNPRHPVRR